MPYIMVAIEFYANIVATDAHYAYVSDVMNATVFLIDPTSTCVPQ